MRTLPKLIANLPLAMVMGAAVAEENTFNLNIPAQPLAAAIEAVSKQTGLQPFYADGALVGKQSPALKGSYSKREAVEKLLAQSGLDYTFTGDNTVAVKAPAAKSAQKAKTEEPVVLDTLTIKAQKANVDQPFGSYLDPSKIALARTATSDTAQMLNGTPGVSFSGGGGISSRPVIHGMADDRLRVQVDGMNLISACANHMNPALSYVAPSSVLSAQVLAGITPVSMGGDSIGGTIRVNSADPEFAEDGKAPLIKGQASTFYRTNGDARGGNISASIANEHAELKYTGSTVQARNYKAGGNFTTQNTKNGSDVVGSSAYKSENQSLSLALRNDDHLAVIKVGQQNIPYQAFPNVRMDMTGDDSWFANVFTKSQFQWGNLETRAYHEDARHKMNFLADKMTTPTRNMPMDTHGVNQGLSVKANIDMTDKHLLTVGSEYQRYRLDDWWDPAPGSMMMGPGTFWNINAGKRDRIDLFTEWEGRWTQQWLTQLGARVGVVEMSAGNVKDYKDSTVAQRAEATAVNGQNKKQTDVNIDWTALARYTFNDMQTYELGAARKTRSPNLYERFAWSRGAMAMFMNNWVGDGNGYVGDINLKPEVAHTVSATANWHDAKQEDWEAKVTPFYTHVENYIDARLCQPGNGVTCASPSSGFNLLQLANFDAHLFGVDVSGSKLLVDTAKYGSLTGKTVLNYVRGRNNDTGGNLYQQMPFNATVALEHKRGGWSNTIETQIASSKTDVQAVRLEPKTAGYALLNLRSSYTWKHLRIDGGIDNLLDKNYALPLGGTYIGERSVAGTAVPGMGRSFNVGMTINY
ncbi:TonB-dependent receptor [Methylobacter tundripaludum]|uniref:TonB-dependent receptor n=1 Tax=Methylobacter tundripaludum (strain ATCC BAA-1195 / DSM 17260 / SV96) TaxID=697282 RepID=G3IXQ4_METTV|nr:TonB-dependent receptor [Methylobacter tundripaludum]EGW23463.1 TonB-dependent receptor [Methylobacter tundripaludum SV96]